MKHALMPSSYHKVNVSRYMLRHATLWEGQIIDWNREDFGIHFFQSCFFIKLVLILTNSC